MLYIFEKHNKKNWKFNHSREGKKKKVFANSKEKLLWTKWRKTFLCIIKAMCISHELMVNGGLKSLRMIT